MKKLILLPVFALVLSACDALDAPKNMVSMKETTEQMSEKMSVTNEAIRMQKLSHALEMLNDPKNQAKWFPVPTKLIPGGKIFAETATTKEILDYTYLMLKDLEEVLPVKGITKAPDLTAEEITEMEKQSDQVIMGEIVPLTDAELEVIRTEKWANLYSLMIIASYAQDEKISEIINSYIKGNDVRQKTGLALLALRAYFIREVLLKVSMKVDNGTAETLDNSGSMNEAIKWLVKLDQVSKLQLGGYPIEVSVEEKTQKLIYFKSFHNEAAKKATAQMWVLALGKAEAGVKVYNTKVTDAQVDANEVAKQNQAMATMKSYIDSWSTALQ